MLIKIIKFSKSVQQILASPVLIIWLVLFCLGIGIGLVCLGLELVMVAITSMAKLVDLQAYLPFWTDGFVSWQLEP